MTTAAPAPTAAAAAPHHPPIVVENLSKSFRLYPRPIGRLVEWLTLGRAVRHSDFHALRNISFRVERGECLGIIGPNGAGKSTLLKILSDTLSPTAGSFHVRGRVLSLLELGTGFSPDLTGRQNVVKTATLLGFPDGYARQCMPEIVAFSGLGEFFDHPIRTYSSGMHVRLAFSMFVAMRPDVLIVDEALAVGDVGFQRKCYQKIEDLLASGVTCLMVTHDLQAVVRFCHRAIVLRDGQNAFEGNPRDACNVLNKLYFGEAEVSGETDYGDGSATIESIWFETPDRQRVTTASPGEPLTFCYTVHFHEPVRAPIFGFHIKTVHGVEVTMASTDRLDFRPGDFRANDRLTLRYALDLNLIAGTYFFGCGCWNPQKERFMARRVDAMKLPVVGVPTVGGIVNPIRQITQERSDA